MYTSWAWLALRECIDDARHRAYVVASLLVGLHCFYVALPLVGHITSCSPSVCPSVCLTLASNSSTEHLIDFKFRRKYSTRCTRSCFGVKGRGYMTLAVSCGLSPRNSRFTFTFVEHLKVILHYFMLCVRCYFYKCMLIITFHMKYTAGLVHTFVQSEGRLFLEIYNLKSSVLYINDRRQ